MTVRPLRQISGDAHFNEVFLDDVAVDEDATVGPVDGGWGVALTTLMFERVTIGLGGEGFGWRADRFAGSLLQATGRRERPGGPPPLRRARGGLHRAALHRLPDAHARCSRAASPAPRAASRR